VHASINQTKTEFDAGTITGRFSVTEPALQQIHARDKRLAEIVRSLFLADPGQKWGSYDYSQIDFRCFAHYVKDPAMLDQYALDPGVDFHKLVANLVGVPRNRDEKTGGANAKQINLAMVFGMGQGALAREMGLPYTLDKRGYYKAGEEAQAVFDKYHKTIPGVQQLRDQVEAVAKKRGYILTPLGRKLRFPDGEGAHKAAGLLFQGAAADIIKYKMIEMYDMFKGTDSRLMLTVHDECCVSMGSFANDAHILELLQRFDGDITPMKFRVPIMCKSGIGEDWFDASKKD
jgi:DNA polymerase-1